MSSYLQTASGPDTGVCPDPDSNTANSTLRSTNEQKWTLSGRPSLEASSQYFAISSDRFTIGRNQDNNLCLLNDTVSGCHAELLLTEAELFVRDLSSTNGTLLNGRKVTSVSVLREGDILHFGNAMFTIQTSETSSPLSTLVTDTEGSAIAQVLFGRLISVPAVAPHLQPIVQLTDSQIVGYEALARSQLVGLETPDKMFHVASQHSAEQELSHICRIEGVRAGVCLGAEMPCFVNTHPNELDTRELLTSLEQLRAEFPDQSITVEMHESGITSAGYLSTLRQLLNDLGMGLAYDDFGSGQTRLMELMDVPPDVLKFDINLVRGLATASPQRRTATAALIRMVQDLGVVALAEGVETREEAEICHECGFELAQGFFFGKPQPSVFWLNE